MSVNPLDDLRSAHEGEYFSKRDRELVDKLRAKLQRERATHDLEESGLADHELAETLAALGIVRDTIPVLHLVPMVQVGWASGRVEPEERRLLELAALQAGVKEGSPAWEAFTKMLDTKPDKALYDAALAYCSAVESASDKASLLEHARAVANATGGLFGFMGNMESAERDALAEIAKRLGVD